MEGGAQNGYRLRSAHGDTVDPRQPLPTDIPTAKALDSVTATLTYNGKAAAAAISVNTVLAKPIMSIEGDQVASYWGLIQNKVYEALNQFDPKRTDRWLTSFVETATSAAFSIYDPSHNLENMFESVTGTTKRFIARVEDTTGHVLYGWIRGVSVASDVYTFEVFNAKTTEAAQSWVGSTSAFVETKVAKLEIYHYNSSLNFDTGTIFTEEVGCPKEYSKTWGSLMEYANSLSNGQYFVDYQRGRIIGKKAATTASETVTYNIWSSTVSGSGFFFRKSTSKTLAGSNTTTAVPIFRLTGIVRVLKLYGVVTTVLGTNNTAAYFRLNDQTAQEDITLNTGVTLSNAAAGSLIIKKGLAGAAAILSNATAGHVLEPTTLETVYPGEFVMVKKPAANTDIEFVYTTTQTPTTGAIQFFAEYQALSADGSLTAL